MNRTDFGLAIFLDVEQLSRDRVREQMTALCVETEDAALLPDDEVRIKGCGIAFRQEWDERNRHWRDCGAKPLPASSNALANASSGLLKPEYRS